MLTVLSGPPCSGKSTWIAEHRGEHDLVIDLDVIAQSLGYPSDHIEWDDRHPAVGAARARRRMLVAMVTKATWHGTAWLVDTTPHPVSLKIYARIGARVIELDPGRATCHERATASGRSERTHAEIDRWYSARGRA